LHLSVDDSGYCLLHAIFKSSGESFFAFFKLCGDPKWVFNFLLTGLLYIDDNWCCGTNLKLVRSTVSFSDLV
jgi:hypothetical protein